MANIADVEKIINDIDQLPVQDKKKLLNTLINKYKNFINTSESINVGKEYEFWINEEDEIYDRKYGK